MGHASSIVQYRCSPGPLEKKKIFFFFFFLKKNFLFDDIDCTKARPLLSAR